MTGKLTKRFLSKIKTNNTDCWLWTASINQHGYGQFSVEGKPCRAHRVSYEMFVGEIPHGMYVLHSCHVRNCVNPKHLRVGSQADNMRDMSKAGRGYCGDVHHKSSLTIEHVNKIRVLAKSGTISQKRIGDMFGVTQSAVSSICIGRTWSKDGEL